MSLRTLVVMRHGKAEQSGPSDYERPLAPRGHGDAAAVGSWLSARGLSLDHALVSGALRTRETWEHVRRGAGEAWADIDVSYDQGLYAADIDTALDLVRGIDDDHGCAIVVGHNPTVAHLAQLLDDGEGDAEAATGLALGFATSATVVFTYDGSWADLTRGAARLESLHVGRG